jgi:hypothetical protein
MGLFDYPHTAAIADMLKEYMVQFDKDVAADAEPVVYLPHGANANFCETVRRRFTAIQFQHNAEDAGNLMQVLAFLVENSIPFGMCAHGNLYVGLDKQPHQVNDGEWILCSTDDVTEDGPADYRVYPTEAFQLEFSWAGTGPSTSKPFTVDVEEMNRVSESAVDSGMERVREHALKSSPTGSFGHPYEDDCEDDD